MDKTLLKLKRVEGQIGGIRKMYEQGRNCFDVVQQVLAVRSALSSVARDLLSDEASRCAKCHKPQDFDKLLKSLVDLS